MRRRIWCETVPLPELAAPRVIALLGRFAVAPIVAIFPHTIDEARPVIAALAESGATVAVWPMLSDADGRWLGAANADRFVAFVDRAARELSPAEIVLDLEPPIAALATSIAAAGGLSHMLPPGVDPREHRAARAALVDLVDRLHARGIAASCAIAPPVALDDGDGWEARLGTPVAGIAWDHVSPMLYTSIIEGWSRGALRRADTEAILAAACAASAAKYGARAGASLGAVGVGAFGDEPTYRSPAELAADVAIARASGVDDLALFDLGGVLSRAPSEPWLEAFTSAPASPALPPSTLRARAALGGLRAAGSALAAITRAADWMSRWTQPR